ncbi:MAG: hypothetical protein H8D96_04745 [Desulfobacterales bacterium]|uniref:Uncharacterized protein n=1 Tax=Candidatus Desulfatibia vada TaxID=2841696 RepID=A0A8J6TJQ4_9BACT|nr:hypothetical protein [Candidatus Desulfatibia vada]
MITDGINSLPVPQAPDIKVEQDLETEEPRAVEDSGKSGDSNLDVSSRNVAKQLAGMDVSKDSGGGMESYNAKGYLVSEASSRQDTGQPQDSISLVV